MIKVTVDFTRAERLEIETFLALPGVSRALDAMTQAERTEALPKLHVAVWPPVVPDDANEQELS